MWITWEAAVGQVRAFAVSAESAHVYGGHGVPTQHTIRYHRQTRGLSDVDEKLKEKPPLPPDDEAQPQRFIENAKQLEADETSKSFEDAFSFVASSTPKAGPSSRKDKT